MYLLHIHRYLIYYNCYFPTSSNISFSLVIPSLSLFFFSPQYTVGVLFFLPGASYMLFQEYSFTSLLLWIPPNIPLPVCHCVYFKLSPTRAVAISFSCQRKDSLKNLDVAYESVFKLVLHTKLDRIFLPSVQSSCKELHRRRFHCTTTNFIGLSNPRDYATQWAPSTGIQLFICVCRYKAFLYSWA